MKVAAQIAAGLAIWVASAGAAQARDLCAAALAAAPGKACVANPYGVALASTRVEAARVAAAVRAGEARFVLHFGRAPPRYAIVQDFRPEELRALARAGFRALPWLTATQFETAALESVRRSTQLQVEAQGMAGEQASAVVQQAEERWREANTPAVRAARDTGVFPHEIGHLWYIQLFWPGRPVDGGSHYGGPGPDWLDETAAILMESDAFAADRRRQFEQVYRGTNPTLNGIPVEELIDLTHFLTRHHPDREFQGSLRPASGISIQVRVSAVDEAHRVPRAGFVFYLQGRMFADFLIERTANPAIFAEIGAAFGQGRTINRWLAERGGAHRLPATLAELDVEWRAWLQTRFGPPGRPGS